MEGFLPPFTVPLDGFAIVANLYVPMPCTCVHHHEIHRRCGGLKSAAERKIKSQAAAHSNLTRTIRTLQIGTACPRIIHNFFCRQIVVLKILVFFFFEWLPVSVYHLLCRYFTPLTYPGRCVWSHTHTAS